MSAIPSASSANPTPEATPPGRLTPRWGVAFHLYTLLANLNTENAIWLIYLAARGYSPFAIGLFEMLFHVAKFVAEVPTGIFADLVGRRASLLASCVLGVVAALLFLDPTPITISVSFMASGVSWAFKGGAQEAVVWTLAEQSRDKPGCETDTTGRYSRLYSRFLVVMLVAAALGDGASGYLLNWSPALPFILRAISVALAIPALLAVPRLRPEHAERPHPLKHLAAGARVAWRSPLLLGLLLLSALEGTVITTANYYTQLYLTNVGYGVAAVGVIFGIGTVMDFLATGAAPRVLARVARRRVIPTLVGGVAAGLLLMATGQMVVGLVGFLLIFRACDSLFVPAISTAINARTPDAQRATILSLETGLFSGGMIVAFPLFGLELNYVTYAQGYLGAALALLAGAGVIAALVLLVRRRDAARPQPMSDTLPGEEAAQV
ncbi:MAG TPA: MFS transporter [Ktedonobacterales bacterium]